MPVKMLSAQPKMILLFLYALVCNILKTNSGTTMIKLNVEESKLLDVSKFPNLLSSLQDEMDDPVFSIITSPVNYENSWLKRSIDKYCTDCQNASIVHLSPGRVSEIKNKTVNLEKDDEALDCGKPVNFTYYDNLVGVANRLTHPNVPESQMGLIYKKKGCEFDVEALERKLKKAKKEKPKSIQLYNQIGNFWRIKGDSYKSIECFRRALAVSPHNAEVLLNLARVLFNLQYLDDAIYLTRRSLEVQPPDRSAWQQYFTLGEIFKAYGHYQEASLHIRHCLQLKPGFEPAVEALNEMEAIPDSTIHLYTLLIIICLVMGVLLVVVSSVECVGAGGGGSDLPPGGSEGRRRGGGRRGRSQQTVHPASVVQPRLLPPPHHFTPHLPPFPPADSTARTALSVTLTSSIVALMWIQQEYFSQGMKMQSTQSLRF